MTRVAAGHPGIWPDICADNREAITAALSILIDRLGDVRDAVAKSDRDAILEQLEIAREARLNLPVGAGQADELAVLRVPVPDRPGTLAEITTLATDLGINIHDVEIAHSSEGPRGVLILTLDQARTPELRDALTERGYRSSAHRLR
jgi:prephenate dehydrogenase